VLGGILIGMIQAYNEGFADARWTTTIVFSILILILVFRPSGLLGERTPEGQ
jgi:branched-chain amino acid transport system permease protein